MQPRLIIPIGRLAIGLFFDAGLSLAEVIGTQIDWEGRVIIPLPHPSGASTWPQKPENQERLKKAIRLIGARRKIMGL